MSSIPVISSLIRSRIDEFRWDFLHSAERLFVDRSTGNLIHPGEFGTYRERLVARLLSQVLPGRYQCATGFLVNPDECVSSQCDLVIYDREENPCLQSTELQRFFPVETVYGVGEVKSTVSKADFKTHLKKLAMVKAMRSRVLTELPLRPWSVRTYPFDPTKVEWHNIVTFLVCAKLDFDLREIAQDLALAYDSVGERVNWHNLILSLDDGMFGYSTIWPNDGNPRETPYPFPTRNGDPCRSEFVIAEDRFMHIENFLGSLSWALNTTTIWEFNAMHYRSNRAPTYQVIQELVK
jgi:hypothetical protein